MKLTDLTTTNTTQQDEMTNKKQIIIRLLVVMIALIVTACGGSAAPTLVAHITEETTEEAVTEATEEPTATEEVEVTEEVVTEEPVETEEPTEEPAQAEATNYQVGDVISMDDVILVVLGWDNVNGDEFTPDEGNKFIAVDVILVNQGDSSTNIDSFWQMKLKDDTAQVYDADLMASLATERSSPDGEIVPGERLRGQVGFQIPENATGLVFVFDADIWDTGKVFVELGAEPNMVAVPETLPGEQALNTYAIGDVIEIGTTTITVNEVTNPPGDTFSKPDEGYIFVVVDLTFQNLGTEAVSLSSLVQMLLKDSTGQGYEEDFMASIASGGTTPDGEVAPGESIRGQVGFQVPEDATGLVFVFDASIWDEGKVFIALQ